MFCSAASMASPFPSVEKVAPDFPQRQQVTCFPGHSFLEQVKIMKLVKKIRSLKFRSTAAGYTNVSKKPVEDIKKSIAPSTGRLLDPATENLASDNRQTLASVLSLSKRIRALVAEPTTARNSVCLDHRNGSPDSQGYFTCPGSLIRSPDSQGYLTCPSSPAGSSDSARSAPSSVSHVQIDSTCASSDPQKSSAIDRRSDSIRNSNCLLSSDLTIGGTSEARRNSTVASSDSCRSPTSGRSQSHRRSASSDLRRYSTGARHEPHRCSETFASSDRGSNSRRSSTGARRESHAYSETFAGSDRLSHSRRYSTGARIDLARHSTFAGSESRRFSTGARIDLGRHSTFAGSESRRFSTGARLDSQRHPTNTNSDVRRYSNSSESDMAHGVNSKKVLKALMAPSISMSSILNIICADEAIVSPRVSLSDLRGSTNARRSSTDREVLRRPGSSKKVLTSEILDNSTIARGPKIEAPEDQDQYSNSNISWSLPLGDNPPQKLDSPTKEEPRQSISGRPSTASIPFDNFTVFVGSERKKFIISALVITHQLFQKLLSSDNYKLEERDGKISIVLLCDIDYFQRLLFLVDQRKNFDMEMQEGRRSTSSCTRRSKDFLAAEPRVSVVSSSG